MHVLAVHAEWECTTDSFNLQVQVQDEISDLNNLHTQQVYQQVVTVTSESVLFLLATFYNIIYATF